MHPDYIVYFNELAGGRPERIRVDSDLDWGQSLNELALYKKRHRIEERIGLGIFGSVDPTFRRLGHGYIASEWNQSIGWVASDTGHSAVLHTARAVLKVIAGGLLNERGRHRRASLCNQLDAISAELLGSIEGVVGGPDQALRVVFDPR